MHSNGASERVSMAEALRTCMQNERHVRLTAIVMITLVTRPTFLGYSELMAVSTTFQEQYRRGHPEARTSCWPVDRDRRPLGIRSDNQNPTERSLAKAII